MAGSKGVVVAALIANAAIAVLKFFGYLLTGSPSMLAETYHSVSDTGNQVFLLVGIRYSKREASRIHPFGHGKAQFFYAFLVSVLLFGIAGWESFWHGVSELRHGGHPPGETGGTVEFLWITIDAALPFHPVWVNVGVLAGAILFETYALAKARAEMRRQIDEYGWAGYREAFRRTSDVTTLTALTEDAIALVGAGLALVGVLASHYTGNPVYDAAATVVIGITLMAFAAALAIENKRLIVGESLPAEDETAIREAIEGHEGVIHVDELRTVFVGPQRALVTADVSFDSDLATGGIDDLVREIERSVKGVDERVAFVFVEPEV